MTNIRTIAGAAIWMFVSALLAAAALEPVSVADSANAPLALAATVPAGSAAIV
ncbi:MAG: hypothetical protein M3Q15_04320 [Pseudomonadota bacterium]|nr:hypothetical protein [Pseudomonadota bacterium]